MNREEDVIEEIKGKINDIYDQYGVNGFFSVIKTIDIIQTDKELMTKSVSGMGLVLDNNTGVIVVDNKDKLALEFLSDSQDDKKQGVSIFIDNINLSKDMAVKLLNFIEKLVKSFDGIEYKNRPSSDTSLN